MMKKPIFGICVVLLFVSVFISSSAAGVSAPKEEWSKTFGGS